MDLLLTTVTSLHENLNVYIVLYYLLFTGFVILFKYNNIQAYIFKQKDKISFQNRIVTCYSLDEHAVIRYSSRLTMNTAHPFHGFREGWSMGPIVASLRDDLQ